MRRSNPRQLSLGYADSPEGGGTEGLRGVSPQRQALLQTAKRKSTTRFESWTGAEGGLLEQAASEQNLAQALLKVVRNKGAPGVDGQTVEEAEADAPRLLRRLRRALLEGSYRPGVIRRVMIPKPGGGERPLGIPDVRDRVVQQALLQVLEPRFEPCFHPSCHGFRPGRGARTAIAEVKEHLAAGHNIVVDLDLARFFDRVHHQRLLARLGRRVSDDRVLKLVRLILRSKVRLEDGTILANREGTPQGGPLSPLLSNVVLDEFDRELERRGHRFVRYADDCQVFVRSERAGHRVMASLTRFLECRMRLSVNQEKSAVRRPEEVHFLGFRLETRKGRDVEVLLSVKTEKRLARTIREMTPRTWGRSLTSCIEAINRYLTGWVTHFRLCTGDGAMRLRIFDAHIRRRLRMIAVRQRKRPRFLVRHLVARGAKLRTAKLAAYNGRGLWYRSNHVGVTRAYPNAWFHERLVSLAQRWLDLNPVPQESDQLCLDF
ncbi:MAG: group II intron reverse transcriptase/maturase [bacterium]|nr:group II intron reverse transcriptase/maturase [bacterium]